MIKRVAMACACPFPVAQGSQALLHDTARLLGATGRDVCLIVYGHGHGPDPGDIPVSRGIKLPGVHKTSAGPAWFKPLLDADLVRALRRAAHRERIDAVHAHNYEGLLVALSAGVRPIIYHAHNAMADELPYYFRGMRGTARLGHWLDRTFPRRADRVIAPHDRLAEYLVACGCNPDRIHVIPPAIDPGLFQPQGISDTMPPIMYTGNLDAYQNLPLLYRAMDLVLADEPEARLILASGDTSRWQRVRQARRHQRRLGLSGGVRERIGWVNIDHFEALRDSLEGDAIVACPRVSWSGYPMKLLNAMAAAKPIVACAAAAPGLTHNHDALIVADDDPAAFAAALLQLLRSPVLRSRLGKAARDTAERAHSPEKVTQQLDALYRDLEK